MNELPRISYKLKEVAEMTGLCVKTLRNRIKDGTIKSAGYCGHHLIRAEDIDLIIAYRRPKPFHTSLATSLDRGAE